MRTHRVAAEWGKQKTIQIPVAYLEMQTCIARQISCKQSKIANLRNIQLNKERIKLQSRERRNFSVNIWVVRRHSPLNTGSEVSYTCSWNHVWVSDCHTFPAHVNRFHVPEEQRKKYRCDNCGVYQTFYSTDLPRHAKSCAKP